MATGIVALVLAAGRSSRSGDRHKLLAPDQMGQPMIARTLQAVCASAVDTVIVVLGHRANDLRAAIDTHAPYAREVAVTMAADHADGLSASLRAGLRMAEARHPSGILVCLGDMPWIGPDVITRLLARHRQSPAPVTVPVHDGRQGHPVLWDRTMIPALMALKGDRGGGALMRALGERVATVQAGATIHEDFDTPDRLDQFAATRPAGPGLTGPS
ncbi:nucleotidyltransferase family protein [Gluconacetobacter diazotrophicus]|uniref:nucleotidyltransferase family protein n=1 Tax=Gluconacetobacter diazotrophicus TaxID=33996 RepID=UPI0002ECB2F3|nr:nucleotidyltransferase family protein [Gluconacetobacter diazotrophicus]